MLTFLPCLDSREMGFQRKAELDIPRDRATQLGIEAVEAIERGFYAAGDGSLVAWGDAVAAARAAKLSLPPDAKLPGPPGIPPVEATRVQVSNETTLAAMRRLVEAGQKPLGLNLANGVNPGGGFLRGSRAQEESLCRSSALYATLRGDRMYTVHKRRPRPDSTDWMIVSPAVPVFRDDGGFPLAAPWLGDFVTCAAPYAPKFEPSESRALLKRRIHRLLEAAHALGYRSLVLGAWGCGAFGNDPRATAADFREALEGPFRGRFDEVAFAIADWSHDRRILGPFRDAFSPPGPG